MISFIYGENFSLIKKELDKKIESFKEGDPQLLNFFKFEGSVDLTGLSSAVNSAPFLASKKLIILRNILEEKDSKGIDPILKIIDATPSFTEVVWAETGTELEKKASVKKILKNKKFIIQSMMPLQGIYLKKKLEEEAKEFGINISPPAWSKLVLALGNNYDRISNEVQKLCLYAKAKNRDSILAEDVDEMVNGNVDESVFKFLDFIAQKNQKGALVTLKKLLDSGQNELYLLSMLVYQYRNIYLIKEAIDQKLPEAEAAKQLRIHPFVIKKSRPIASKYTYSSLRKIYFALEDSEIKMKTGKVEPLLGISLLVNRLAK